VKVLTRHIFSEEFLQIDTRNRAAWSNWLNICCTYEAFQVLQ
jgi:hypothetical protein